MALATLADYQAAARQNVRMRKLTLGTPPSGVWYSLWPGTGSPGAGGAAGNTANGTVPTATTTGAPAIVDFSGGVGKLTRLRVSQHNNQATYECVLFDRLFSAGAYAFNANTTLTAQPSFSSRIPGGTDYSGLQIWYETVTSPTGVQSVAVTYTDQSGNTGHTTGTISVGNISAATMLQLPLQAGDCGVQKIESVVGTVASAGTFSITVLRPIARFVIPAISPVDLTYGMDALGAPQVWSDSCFALAFYGNSNQPIIDAMLEIASN